MPDTPVCPLSGPWSWLRVAAFLTTAAVPMRLAANTASGFPVVTPLWFAWSEGALWAASQPEAKIIKHLRRDGRCAFDISIETPPYRGVRGRGHASIEEGGLDTLKGLLARYLGGASPQFQEWLLARSADECAIRIVPERLVSWDFSGRMGT